jgi:hypothetical protein
VPFAWLPDWLLRHWWRPFAWLLDWWSRRWRRIALVLLVLVAVLLVVRAALDLWAGRRLSAEISRLEKVYGRLDPATLAPPRVPPAENRARVMRAAASLTNVNTWAALGRSYAPTVPATPRPEDRQIVEENRLAVQVAEQGRRRPKSNWEIDYANDEANFPRLLDVRTLGRVLAASCRVDVDAGRPDQAAEAALAGLAEAASLGGEPPAIIQLIRIAIAREQMACVQGLLERDQPAAAALTELAMALVENRTPDPIHIAFIGELKHANYVFGQMERGDVGRDVRRYIVNPSPVWAGPVRWLCRPLIRYGRLRYLRRMARMLELQSVPPFARSPSDLTAWPQTRYPKWWQVVQRFDATFIGGGLTLMAEDGYCYMSQLNGAELAVALRRFRLDRGRYPDALAELAPQYLAQVPIDPFTGRPPEYTRQGEGFELRGHGPPRWVPVEDSRLLEWKVSR